MTILKIPGRGDVYFLRTQVIDIIDIAGERNKNPARKVSVLDDLSDGSPDISCEVFPRCISCGAELEEDDVKGLCLMCRSV